MSSPMLETGTVLDHAIPYIIGGLGLAVLVVRSLPDIFGPLGRFVTDWTDQRQRIKGMTVAAEVAALQTSVKLLEEHLNELRLKATAHSSWDRKVYTALLRNGIADDLGVPPDLF